MDLIKIDRMLIDEEKKYTLLDVPQEFLGDPLYKAVLTAKDKKAYDKALDTLKSIRGSSAVQAIQNAIKKHKKK